MTALLEVRDLTRAFGAQSRRRRELRRPRGRARGADRAERRRQEHALQRDRRRDRAHLRGGRVQGPAGRRLEARAARAGVARTFQIPKPYRHLSVLENVALSALLHERSGRGGDSAGVVLAEVGLADYLDVPVANLTVGLLKRLEVARDRAAAEPRSVRRDHGWTDAERSQGHDQPGRRSARARHHRDLGRARALRDHERRRASWCSTAAN